MLTTIPFARSCRASSPIKTKAILSFLLASSQKAAFFCILRTCKRRSPSNYFAIKLEQSRITKKPPESVFYSWKLTRNRCTFARVLPLVDDRAGTINWKCRHRISEVTKEVSARASNCSRYCRRPSLWTHGHQLNSTLIYREHGRRIIEKFDVALDRNRKQNKYDTRVVRLDTVCSPRNN